jgi:hypothetical protein
MGRSAAAFNGTFVLDIIASIGFPLNFFHLIPISIITSTSSYGFPRSLIVTTPGLGESSFPPRYLILHS